MLYKVSQFYVEYPKKFPRHGICTAGKPIDNFHSGFAWSIFRAHPLPRSRSAQACQLCIMPPISMTAMSLAESPAIFHEKDALLLSIFQTCCVAATAVHHVSSISRYRIRVRCVINFSSLKPPPCRRNPLHAAMNILRPNIHAFAHFERYRSRYKALACNLVAIF